MLPRIINNGVSISSGNWSVNWTVCFSQFIIESSNNQSKITTSGHRLVRSDAQDASIRPGAAGARTRPASGCRPRSAAHRGCARAWAGPAGWLGAQQPAFDLLIRGGRIVDGTGNPWFAGDVGIRGDRIVAVGRLTDASATREIDARGLVVAPGFIDLHTHSDLPLLNDGNAESKVRQGVTLDVHRREHDGRAARRPAGGEGHLDRLHRLLAGAPAEGHLHERHLGGVLPADSTGRHGLCPWTRHGRATGADEAARCAVDAGRRVGARHQVRKRRAGAIRTR